MLGLYTAQEQVEDVEATVLMPNTLSERLSASDFLDSFELNFPPVDKGQVEQIIADLLQALGEDTQREGLANTPHRVARMYEELLSGYRVDPARLINNALFEADYDQMVVVHHIEFSSLCEHHMLPFTGYAHVAYLPQGKVIGLSKIPRIVDMFARRLQIQERMTQQIAEFLDQVLQPRGVAVVVEGKHMCSMMRGVGKQHPTMTSSTLLGEFRHNEQVRHDFMAFIRNC
jgi:GTP cyclohydrolase IA